MIFKFLKKEKKIEGTKKIDKADKREKERIKKKEEKRVEKPLQKESNKKEKETLEEKREKGSSRRKKHYNISLNVLESPHITEKATRLEGENKYIFKVEKRANKKEVKRVVEELYGVNVLSVRIINIPRKKRRLGRIEGFRRGYKKAIVKIKEGQKINILSK